MSTKVKFSLGKKLTLLIVLMGVILSLAAILASYRVFSSTMTRYYERLATNLVRTLATQLDADKLDYYYETGEMDGDYYATQDFIRDMVDSNDVEYLYVVRPHGTGVTFLFDSDMERAVRMRTAATAPWEPMWIWWESSGKIWTIFWPDGPLSRLSSGTKVLAG